MAMRGVQRVGLAASMASRVVRRPVPTRGGHGHGGHGEATEARLFGEPVRACCNDGEE